MKQLIFCIVVWLLFFMMLSFIDFHQCHARYDSLGKVTYGPIQKCMLTPKGTDTPMPADSYRYVD